MSVQVSCLTFILHRHPMGSVPALLNKWYNIEERKKYE